MNIEDAVHVDYGKNEAGDYVLVKRYQIIPGEREGNGLRWYHQRILSEEEFEEMEDPNIIKHYDDTPWEKDEEE